VKKISLLLAVLGLSVAGSALAAQTTKDVSPHALGERSIYSERATIERITAVGRVCVEGKECEGAPAAVAAAPAAADGAAAAGRPGDAVYNASCSACHGTGAAGAPKLGDKGAWGPRIAQGKATLHKHAIMGIRAMPPKGMCMTCSDDEIMAAVDYMVGKAK